MPSGGAIFPAVNAAVLLGGGAIRVYQQQQAQNAIGSAGPYTPPQWSQPALTMITVPPQYNILTPSNGVNTITDHAQTVDNNIDYSSGTATIKTGTVAQTATPTYLVFDAVIRLSHSQRAQPTRLPVQAGASMTDHILLQPATLGLSILMTDALPAYASGQWVGNSSKSVSCFQVLDALRAQRIPVTVTTRLKTYTNMVITDVPAEDTVQTRYGLRAQVLFEQINIATVSTQGVSARTQTTDTTSQGQTQPAVVPAGVTSLNGLPSAATGAPSSADLQAVYGYVPGAGNWSSNPTSPLGGS